MLAAAVVLSSCSKQDDLQPTDDTVQVTISTQAPQTRAAVRGEGEISAPTRFIIEVYEGGAVSGDATMRFEHLDGSFSLTLKKGTTYSFLYWADYGTPNDNSDKAKSHYNAADLKAVTPIDNTAHGQLAYCGSTLNTVITSGSEGFTVTLKHAVAQMIYDNTMAFTSATGNSLQVTYPYSATFNVGTGKTVTTTEDVVRTFTIAAAESTDKTVGVIATDYLFAPDTEAQLATLKMVTTIDGVPEEERAITNVPIQLNYTTRIKGAFSNLLYDTSFDVSNSVEDMEEQDHNF